MSVSCEQAATRLIGLSSYQVCLMYALCNGEQDHDSLNIHAYVNGNTQNILTLTPDGAIYNSVPLCYKNDTGAHCENIATEPFWLEMCKYMGDFVVHQNAVLEELLDKASLQVELSGKGIGDECNPWYYTTVCGDVEFFYVTDYKMLIIHTIGNERKTCVYLNDLKQSILTVNMDLEDISTCCSFIIGTTNWVPSTDSVKTVLLEICNRQEYNSPKQICAAVDNMVKHILDGDHYDELVIGLYDNFL